jgi:hypothetical protein
MITGIKPKQEMLLPKVATSVKEPQPHANLRRLKAELDRSENEYTL